MELSRWLMLVWCLGGLTMFIFFMWQLHDVLSRNGRYPLKPQVFIKVGCASLLFGPAAASLYGLLVLSQLILHGMGALAKKIS